MEEASYLKLAEHLDRLPGGFAPSETGADIRLLQRLFTPEEAKLATYLTLDREEAGVIARRADLLLAEVERARVVSCSTRPRRLSWESMSSKSTD